MEIAGEGRWILLSYAIFALLSYYLRLEEQQKLIHLLYIVAALVSIYTIQNAFFGYDFIRGEMNPYQMQDGSGLYRARGFFRNPLTYAYSMGMLFCFLSAHYWYCIKNQSSRLIKILFAGALVAIFIGLMLTLTRGLWLSLVFTLVLMAIQIGRVFTLRLIVSLTVVAIFIAFLFPFMFERAQSIIDLKDQSNYQRIDIWRANWEMFKDHPLIGVGVDQNDNHLSKYYSKLNIQSEFYSHAHNNYFQVLAGNGALGFICFIMMLWGFLKPTLIRLSAAGVDSYKQALLLGCFGAQIIFLFSGLTESTFIDNEVWHMFMFLWLFQKNGVLSVDS
jgi:O-antigen ligase